MTIPARAHFIWIGPRLPWAYAFAVLSAAVRGGLDEVVLHHSDTLEPGPELSALKEAAAVRLQPLDPIDLLGRVEVELGVADSLTEVYRRLHSPAAKSDILRAAILYLEGGIYLDIDTVTVRSLVALLNARAFIGCERIVWPGFVRRSRSPSLWLRSLGLDLLRKLLRRIGPGWRWFRKVEHWYYRGINNAILGAAAGAPLLAQYLRAMLAVPVERQALPWAIGPHLLQAMVATQTDDKLQIHPPGVFFPLGPEISEHWFYPRRRIDLKAVLRPETCVVHWYASVHTRTLVDQIDPAYVGRHRRGQLYSALVNCCLPGLVTDRDSDDICAPVMPMLAAATE